MNCPYCPYLCCGLQLKNDHLLQLNLYNLIENYLQEFAVENKETDFLFNYLEMLYAYCQNACSIRSMPCFKKTRKEIGVGPESEA